MLDPLHHLLAGDLDDVALAKLLLDPVIRQMIVEAGQSDIHGEPQSELAVRNQTWRQRRNRDAPSPQRQAYLGRTSAADHPRRNEVNLLGHFFANAIRHFAAAKTRRQIRLDSNGFGLQVAGQRMA